MQMKQAYDAVGIQQDNGRESRTEKQTDLQHSRKTATGFFFIVGTETMPDLHLPSDRSECAESVGKPGDHAGDADAGDGIASETSDKEHVDDAVRHLDQTGQNDRNGKAHEHPRDAAGQKIIFINLIHTIPVFVRPFSDRSQTSEHYSICPGNSKLAEPAFFLFLYMKLPRLYNSSDFCKNSEVII